MTSGTTLANRRGVANIRPQVLRLDWAFALGVLVVLVFLFPARAVVSGLGAAGRPHLLLGAGLLLGWLVMLMHPRLRSGPGHPLIALVLGYVGWVTLAWAAGYGRGLVDAEGSSSDRALITTFAYLGVVLVAARSLRNRAAIDRVLRTVVLGASFSALMGWIQFWFNLDLTPYLIPPGLEANASLVGISARGAGEFARVAGTAGHYIEFGVVAAMLLPLAVHYTRRSSAGWRRRFGWLTVVLIGAAVPFSLSRSAVVAFALTAFVMLVGWPRRVRWNAIAALVMAVPVFMVIKPGLLGTIRSLFVNAANDPSITGRTEDYDAVWRYVTERPLIGRGPGTFTPEIYRLLDNQWLLSLIEIGWLGVALLALLLLSTMRVLLTVRRRALFIGDERGSDLALCLLAVVVTFTVTSFFFDSFSFTTATTMLWLSIGLACALATIQRRELAALGIYPMSLLERWVALARIARGRDELDEARTGAWI